MGRNTNQQIISDEELHSLAEAIYTRHGINFNSYEPRSLKRRLKRALHVFELGSVHELWIKILRDRSFIYPLIDTISVGLTSMFRDPILWRSLKNLMGTNQKEELSIWHAGCSTGEEVYTMAIVLREIGLLAHSEIWATDISRKSLEQAETGEFHLLKLNEFQNNYKKYNPSESFEKYYTPNHQTFKIKSELVDHANFSYHNLLINHVGKKFDIIFCRNVMIYFDNQTKIKLLDKFYQALKPRGLLVIGFYDAVLPIIDETKFEVLDMDAKIFKRRH